MSDEYELTEVIREYEKLAEAMAHLAALQAEGIAAVLAGDVPNGANFHWLAGRLNYAPIQLVVPASQRGQAERILLQLGEPLPLGWEADAESAIEGWLCPTCDTVTAYEEIECAGCGGARPDGSEGDEQADDEDD